ncbi:hypothetical protein HQ584_06380 [Patescibacteria group bacterium]|nr:hypothetical protein [Patescibacteria group bacterium]
MLTNCFREIKDLETQYYQKYEGKSEKEEMAWRSLFLNTLEFQAFLFNRDYLPREEFLEFFCDVIRLGYEKILPKVKTDVTDSSKFPELKGLYAKYLKRNNN